MERGGALAGTLRDGALLNSHAFEPPRSAQNGEGGAVCGANCQFDCKKRIITGSLCWTVEPAEYCRERLRRKDVQ